MLFYYVSRNYDGYNRRIHPLEVAQVDEADKEIRAINGMQVLYPLKLKDIIKEFNRYYKPHKANKSLVYYWFDHTAVGDQHETRICDDVVNGLRKEGWTVVPMYLGNSGVTATHEALFAAVGSAVDAPSDAQQFMFPITIPLIVAYMGLFVFVLQEPNSTTSFWLSVIPLTSPIAMMGRISYGVPFWELTLSIGLLILGFLFTTWLAGKIYRIGILMHGTKPTYKILWKWIRSSQ